MEQQTQDFSKEPIDCGKYSVRDWVDDFAHENGMYENRCSVCGNIFLGHKRRVVCGLCFSQPTEVSVQIFNLRKALEVADEALGFVRNRLDLASAAKNLPFAIERVNEAQADIQQARTEIQNILKQGKTHEG